MLQIVITHTRKEMREKKLYFKIVCTKIATGRVLYEDKSPGRRERKYYSDPSFQIIDSYLYSKEQLNESKTNRSLFDTIFKSSSYRPYTKKVSELQSASLP